MIKVPYHWAIRSLQLIKLHHDSTRVTAANHAVPRFHIRFYWLKVQRESKKLRRRGLNYLPVSHLHMPPAPTNWNFLNSH